MSYRLIDSNEIAIKYPEVNEMDCIYVDLPNGLDNEYHYIEAEPRKHGRWLIGVGENGEPIGTYCSECGWSWERNVAAIQLNKVLSLIETPRCPNCGAKMNK